MSCTATVKAEGMHFTAAVSLSETAAEAFNILHYDYNAKEASMIYMSSHELAGSSEREHLDGQLQYVHETVLVKAGVSVSY